MSTQQQQTSIVVVSPNNREAKKVIDYKIFNGKRYYKVKWESSWESEDSLGDYQYLVDQFWDFVKRVSSEDSDSDPVRKRPRLSHDENENQEEEAEDRNVNNSEEDIQIKGTITLSEGVKIQESGNFYRLTQEKETGDENDGSVFIVQGSHSPLHSIKNTQSRVNKGNVHVIGLQHDPKSESTYSRKIRHHEDGESNPSFTSTDTDKALHWDNPYVRIAFFCRFCKQEQEFDLKQDHWKAHFESHVTGVDEEKTVTKEKSQLSTEERQRGLEYDEDLLICKDSDVPWIQKVEMIIQKWGINQYMRMAFLCRVCGKEQQPHHTGNWRNHHQSHSVRKTVECDVCGKMFKSKHELKKHKKEDGEEHSLGSASCISDVGNSHACQICGQGFRRRIEVKKHIAECHSIDPENLRAEMDCEDKATQETSQVTLPQPLIVNVTSLTKSHSAKETSSAKTSEPQPTTRRTKTPSLSKVVVQEEEAVIMKPSLEQKQAHIKIAPRLTKPAAISKPAITRSSNRNFVCGVCSRNCKTKNDLKIHKRDVHFLGQVEESSTYTCSKCQKTFHKHIELTNHTIEHHGIDEAIKPTIPIPNVSPSTASDSATNLVEMEEKPASESVQQPVVARLSTRKGSYSEGTGELVIVIKEESISDNEEMCIDFPDEEKPPPL